MNIVIDYSIAAPPPPAQPKSTKEQPNRQLTYLYVKNNRRYEIDCFHSPCRTKCHFSNTEFGEAIFEKETETFIAATRTADEHYVMSLSRALRQWKKQFPHF